MPETEITIREVYDLVNKIDKKVDVLHDKVVGRGGAYDRLDALEKSDKEQNKFILKAIGAVSLLAILIPIAIKFFA
jgi:hypothetical protein